MTITGPEVRSGAPGPAVVDAALLLLERMGPAPADRLPPSRPSWSTRITMPTAPSSGQSLFQADNPGTSEKQRVSGGSTTRHTGAQRALML
jgi:hypothetical protein